MLQCSRSEAAQQFLFPFDGTEKQHRSHTEPSPVLYMFDYGDFDQRTAIRIGGRTLVSYAYDSKKQLDRTTYGNNDFVDYDYDAKGRLISQTYETGETVTYAYDNSGNLATVTDSATGITTTYYYDLLDRQVGYREKSADLDHSVTCIYNADNLISSVTEVINGVTTTYTYTYDEDNRVTNVAIGDLTVSYSYDAFGRLENRTVKNGDTVIQTTAPTYAPGKEAGTTTGQISSYNGYTYTYDKNGNILSVTDGTYTTSYEYDSANQLTRENNQQLGFTHTWTYDNAGNILSRSEYPYTVGALGIPTDTVEYTYKSSASWGDMIDSYGANDYLPHDGAGNLRYDGEWIYNWQHGRELTSMTKDNTTWTFSYDANGMRTKRTDGLTTYTYVYSGSQLVEMYFDGQDELRFSFTYDTSGTPVSVTVDGSSIYYYVTNLQGDVVGLLNENGQQVATYIYDAWGNVTSHGTEPIEIYNPLLYRGYVYDWETGLYYLQSRYYNPEWGRFINADGAYDTNSGFLGHNMYVYCLNNPVNMFDPDGRCSSLLWFKFDCKKASCPTSRYYIRPKAIAPIGSYNRGRGYVYVITEDQLSIMEDREDNVVVILDKRTASDPNMQIQASYRITNTQQQEEIAQLMINYNASNPVNPAWSRTLDSLVEEWKIHNFAYFLWFKRERTADCDFNNADEGKGFWDFIGR